MPARKHVSTEEAYQAYVEHGTLDKAAAVLKIAPTAVDYHVKKWKRQHEPTQRVEVPEIPDGELSISELLELRKDEFTRKKAYWESRRCIPVKVKIDGPFAIHFFGDPHLDDPGTDLGLLESHVRIIQSNEAILAANVGDTTNNWVGRLAVKYADQQATKWQGWQLTEWFIGELAGSWLFLVAGNHDLWSGGGDPLNWIKKCGHTIYEPSQVRMELKASGDSILLNTRHDFHGSSQYNPAHGPQKASIFGYRDHINVCGHRHKSGYSVYWDMQHRRLCHNVQVAAYKVYDDYAREKGFPDQHISPSATAVITPGESEQRKVHIFWDLEEAADFLEFKRR